ncbi:MAG TPA: hypothetical protein PLC76_11875 [Saprospiraceae bacterium]|jgi:hypothetical protein|nr:MAG: hypothetical protein UZ08_BCD001001863 [Candidatus Parvibacillus calidus]MBX2936994.1 hypothetical protein [Saprospiraceae bacterium]MBK7739704.1 hypothetical protein [Candidatus Parvibacillus calidus]MBX7180093.1 hypothetical protein [Saprospiraceae bacterium]MCB0591768.1 hypothetical protein [Saprospiraceae bacterium]
MQNISFKTKSASMFSGGLLSFVFMLLFALMVNNGLNAQATANSGVFPANHEVSTTAAKYGVQAANLDTWDNAKATAVVKQQLAQLNPASTNPQDLFKLVYYQTMLEDLRYNVSPAVTSVLRLKTANGKVNNSSITLPFIRSVYNELTNKF